MAIENLSNKELRKLQRGSDFESRLNAGKELDRRKKERSPLSKGEWWTIAGVIVGVVAIIATGLVAIFLPEIRRSWHMDEPTKTETALTQVPAGQAMPRSTAKAMNEPTKVLPSETAKAQNRSVASNESTNLDQNKEPGKKTKAKTSQPTQGTNALANSPAHSLPTSAPIAPKQQASNTQICPGGICANGPIIGNPQINNFGRQDPPPRKVQNENGRAAIDELRKFYGSRVRLVAVGRTKEMRDFSTEIAGLFSHGGWSLAPGSGVADIYAWGQRDGSQYRGEGVACVGPPDSLAFRSAKQALTDAGYPCKELDYLPQEGNPDATIIIGTRMSPDE